MKKTNLIIIAHPDDETIWMGGTILRNKHQNWTIISHCRASDKDRAPKFKKVCKRYKAKPIISDLDDEKLKAFTTKKIISEINSRNIEDKIILLRVSGEIDKGKNSDIKFSQIEEHAKKKGAYFILRNTHDLKTKEIELEIEVKDSENIEEEAIKMYSEQNPSDFNDMIPELINYLSIEKQEDEKNDIFTNRLLEGARKVLKF